MPLIAESKYDAMKKETQDVLDIFLDDTKDSEQTIQLITQFAEAAIAIQGLGEVPAAEDKVKVVVSILLDIASDKLRSNVVEAGV